MRNLGEYDLTEINSDDPEVLDFSFSASKNAENLAQSIDTSPETRNFIKVLTGEGGDEIILSSLEKLKGSEEGYDDFIKLITDIIELQKLREKRRVDLMEVSDKLSSSDLSEADKQNLENLKQEYTRELRQDFLDGINRSVEKLFSKYPQLVAKLNINY